MSKEEHRGDNITLEDSGRFRVKRKYGIFKNLGVGWKETASNARRLQAESRKTTMDIFDNIEVI